MMKRRVWPLRALGVLALAAATGGCELMKYVRIQADDRNPNSFAQAREPGAPAGQADIALEFRLRPGEGRR